MTEETKAVYECRKILTSFVRGVLDYAAFRSKMASAMESLDPLDWALEKLNTAMGKEAKMYVEWLGGEFGETEDLIPRRPEWKYGESDEPYEWVDQDEYRRLLSEAFAAILEKDT
jgi:hypothetical protein